MNNFTFSVSENSVSAYYGSLNLLEKGDIKIYFSGLENKEVDLLLSYSSESELLDFFNKTMHRRFFAFVHDKNINRFYAFNDKFGYNEIFVEKNADKIVISSEVHNVPGKTINHLAAYEFLSFQNAVPPKTIFNEVEIVPLAQCVIISLDDMSHEYRHYWKYDELFTPKADNYEKLTKDLQKAFYEGIVDEYVESSAVSLSGGIDSGGILGILRDHTDDELLSVSFGPYGKKSGDLESSRITSKEYSSRNIELYPSEKMFMSLLDLNKGLHQPISGDLLLSVSEIFKAAKTENIKKLYFGYGTQMLLGNLVPNKLWHRTRLIHKILPHVVVVGLFKLTSKIKGFSINVEEMLVSKTWPKKFFHMQAALFTRERHIFKTLPEDFISEVTEVLQPFMDRRDLKLSDRFVLFFMHTWTNYGQGRNAVALGNVFEMEVALPFNTPKVAEVICKTPDKFRMKNKWNKQLWRDAMLPYVPEHLYMRKGKSLTIPYNKLILPQAENIISYLESNSLMQEIINFDVYKKDLNSLPEPGLSLLRLINLAIWYDQRFDKVNIEKATKVLSEINFDKEMTLI